MSVSEPRRFDSERLVPRYSCGTRPRFSIVLGHMPKRLADWVAPTFTCGHGSFCAPVSVSQPNAYVTLNIHLRTNSKMLANHISKSLKPVVGAAVLALALSINSPAQNVGIGFSNPVSK